MKETHPYGEFVPKNAKYLILGSFPGKKESLSSNWFYGAKRNQFWKILEIVYDTDLPTIDSKKRLFRKLKIAMGDIIKSCVRRKGNNLDSNLTNVTYNTDGISKMLNDYKIQKIFFSSRFVEKKFKSLFKNKGLKQELVALPCPSPRYAKLNFYQKVKEYKKVLPKLSY